MKRALFLLAAGLLAVRVAAGDPTDRRGEQAPAGSRGVSRASTSGAAGVSTTITVCGVVTAFTDATLVLPGLITIGGQTFPIAAGTALDGAGLIRTGANLCLSGTLNASGQLVAPSSVTANATTSISVCGVVTAFTSATALSNGSITIGGQTFPIAAGTTLDGASLIRAGANLCLSGTLNGLGQLVVPSSVTANATTSVSVCGVVTAFTPATATSNGSITIAGQTFPIAAGTTLDGASLITAGANLCLNGTLNASGQLVVPSSVTANATTSVSVCGVVTAFTAATATSNGSITIAGQTFPIAAGTTLDGSSLITAGANLCLNGTLNASGQLIVPSSVTANATTSVNVCGVVTAFTAATATSNGSITIGGQTLPIAAGTALDGAGQIQLGANFCLTGTLNASGQLVPPSSISAGSSVTLTVCGLVTAFAPATGTSAGSLTIGGRTFTIAPGTVAGQIRVGDTLCLSLTLNAGGQVTDVIPASADLSISKAATPEPVSVSQTLTYSINVVNKGPSAATGVTMSDPIPSSVTFLSAIPSQGSCSGSSTVVCALGTLAAGRSATVTIKVVPNQAGSLTNMASVSSETPEPFPANNTATVVSTVLSGGSGGGGGGGTGAGVHQEIIFPVVAHVSGAGGSQWRTDLRLVNLGSAPTTARIEWFPFSPGGHSGPDQVREVVVNPGSEGVFDQSLMSLFNTNGAGSLRVVFDSLTVGAALRIFDDQRGATCDGIQGSFEKGLLVSESNPRGALLVLAQNPSDRHSFRSAIGYFNASDQPETITFNAFSADGRLLGSKTISVPAFANDQKSIFDLIDTVAPGDRIQQDLFITFQAQGGLPFVYAFAVFNSNNDPMLVSPWAF